MKRDIERIYASLCLVRRGYPKGDDHIVLSQFHCIRSGTPLVELLGIGAILLIAIRIKITAAVSESTIKTEDFCCFISLIAGSLLPGTDLSPHQLTHSSQQKRN